VFGQGLSEEIDAERRQGMPAMQKDEICQPLRRKDHLQHMLSYESAEQDGKEDENLSVVQQAKVRQPFQRNIV
jgi:hypothetical protein